MHLFFTKKLDDYFREKLTLVDKLVKQLPPEQILNTDEKILADYLTSRCEVEKINLGEGISSPPIDGANGKRSLSIQIPIIGNTKLLECIPRNQRLILELYFSNMYENILELIFDCDYVNESEEIISKRINHVIEGIKYNTKNLNEDVNQFNNSQLKEKIKQSISERRKILVSEKKVIELIKFPIKEVHESQDFAIPLKPKKIELPPIQKSSNEYYLAYEDYHKIIEIINRAGKAIEKSSEIIRVLGEEHLRDFFVIQLNGHYENQVTGETFNVSGKTDILIKTKEGGNVFVAECKFWDGGESLNKAINQLLCYLSWRDSKTSLIIFNKNKNFTDVIEKANLEIKKHPNFLNTDRKIDETSTLYKFKQLNDPKKELYLCMQLFDLKV